MKKLKYLIVIIVIGVLVFIGIEAFRKVEHEGENNTINEIEEDANISTGANITNTSTDNTNETQQQNSTTLNSTEKMEEVKNGEELMQKAEKTLTARGWAGASSNVIGLKDGIIYYYNKATGEFYSIAEGIEDIYYATDYAEEITAKKKSEFKELKDALQFLVYE